jgi:hypothetical protein
MARSCGPAQFRAIIHVTKKFGLGTMVAVCTVSHVSMTASLQHQLRLCGAASAVCQQRCDAMRPVVVAVWFKHTGTGIQN